MKLTFGLTAALAGCAVAAQQAADVYILPTAASSASSSSTPSISRSLARLILLQRLAPAGKGPSISEIPDDSDIDNVVSMMNQFGKEPVSLFGQGAGSPSQLVVMLEGLTGEQMKDLGGTFNSNPAFTIADPPNSGAHDNLLKNDFYNVGITNEHKCSLQQVSNPFEEQCWSGKSTVAKYNVQKVLSLQLIVLYQAYYVNMNHSIPRLSRISLVKLLGSRSSPVLVRWRRPSFCSLLLSTAQPSSGPPVLKSSVAVSPSRSSLPLMEHKRLRPPPLLHLPPLIRSSTQRAPRSLLASTQRKAAWLLQETALAMVAAETNMPRRAAHRARSLAMFASV